MVNVGLYLALLGAVAIERGLELALSNRNLKRQLALGAVEYGAGHYRVMVVLHSLFLCSCAVEVVALRRAVDPFFASAALVALAASMALRYWSVATLGDRWNTRVVVLPSAPPVVSGPYRWLRHPNYVAVIIEIAALPLVHGAWVTALLFSVANALLLAVRIRVEEQALGERWAAAFARTPRFIPRGG